MLKMWRELGSRVWFSQICALAALAFPVLGGEPASSQNLLKIHLNLNLSTLLSEQIQKVEGDIPIHVVTDKKGRIEAFVAGGSPTPFRLKNRDGTNSAMPLPEFVFPTSTMKKGPVKMESFNPIHLNLFTMDASRLDPQEGGPVTISYMGSPVSGSMNTVELQLAKVDGLWVAFRKGEGVGQKQMISGAEIQMGTFGIGLDEPNYVGLDPNQIVSINQVQRIQNGRVAADIIKSYAEYYDSLSNSQQQGDFKITVGTAQ